MAYQPNVAPVAALIGDPVRAAMLAALADGRALPAGELAQASGVTAQTASSHLAKLLGGELLAMERQGRHRYYRLASPEVALAIEHLAAIGPRPANRKRALPPSARHLQFARCCYHHLAGRLGVGLTDGLCARGLLAPATDKSFEVTAAGRAWFLTVGLDTEVLPRSRRPLARQCLDWTERRHHLAGPVGVGLLTALCQEGWLRRAKAGRAIEVTPKGYREFKRQFDIDGMLLRSSASEEQAASPALHCRPKPV